MLVFVGFGFQERQAVVWFNKIAARRQNIFAKTHSRKRIIVHMIWTGVMVWNITLAKYNQAKHVAMAMSFL